MSIYSNVKHYAYLKQLSIAEIERQVGFSNGSISKWKSSQPSALSLQRIAKHLDVTIDDLINDHSNEEHPKLRKISTVDLIKELSKRKEARLLRGGIYAEAKLQGKYSQRDIELPANYWILLINDSFQLDSN
ncbi:helix-turn-helix domain-containing protein [Lentilactobacillus hilgardii]|uniref:Helix-turn-helix domain-containing protein n=1 Tax=Lentilactobacillus hilgardii TaxID=1588 RepID=A0A6P1EA51_LENHI|nr:helix-turn-helix transcriptional regulator [Lentilactobacillus hilgardii]QHB52485.1 helix-turn-helix domain-containing protein [Lentilactobacillus hilgardii]